MKKLILAVAVVGAAIGLKAAQFDWTFEADDAMGTYTVSDAATFYMVSGTESVGSTLANILDTKGVSQFTTALGDYAFQTGKLNGGALDGGRVTGIANGSQYAALFIFNNGLVDNAEFAYTVYDVSNSIYTPPSSGEEVNTYASDWGDSDYAESWGSGTVAVPEPTSGLLILLGMAGLALKRKRA